MNDLIRYIVAVELLALILALTGMWAMYHEQVDMMPRAVKAVFGAVLYVLAAGSSAVVVNALVGEESNTPGGLLIALLVAPAVVACLGALVWSVKRPPPHPGKVAAIRNAALLADSIEHLAHLEPCPNPDCLRVRGELAKLIGSGPLHE